ncbi:MAG: hypothetical protein QXF56_03605 [Candidatus Micrarchaeia archaeon]
MQDGCERGWNGRGLRCSGCEKEVGKKEFFAEIEEWNGEKKVFCGRCFDRWLRE